MKTIDKMIKSLTDEMVKQPDTTDGFILGMYFGALALAITNIKYSEKPRKTAIKHGGKE